MIKTLRTPESDIKYKDYFKTLDLTKFCPMCEEQSIKDFNGWRIIDNRFPYDLVAKTHHILVSKRHVKERELNPEEREELEKIKESYISTQGYHWIIEAMGKSFPDHFHLHLIVGKDDLAGGYS